MATSAARIDFDEGSAPASPDTGQVRLYAKSDGLLYSKDDAGAETLVSSGAGAAGVGVVVNEIMNFPSQERADDTQPEWWEESAGTATLTEVDLAGEAITERWERALKLVTTASVYAYQRYTYADQPRLKSGSTVSARVAVWSVSSAAARIRLQSSVGSLGVSADATAAGWTILTVEGEVLDGTYIELRLEVDTGTAYFVPLAFGIGSTAPSELAPRGTVYRHKHATAFSDAAVADPNTWTDLDLTSVTSPIACIANLFVNIFKSNASGWDVGARRNGSSDTGDSTVVAPITSLNGTVRVVQHFAMLLDDGQIFEYKLDRWAGTDTATVAIGVTGWWEWA
jgi:hypothetical protein